MTSAEVAAARDDEAAFRELVAPFLAELRAHCYRMLGSVHDADDALQDVLFRAWRGLAGFEGRSSLRSWLYRIATNVCLNMIERGPAPVEPYPDAELPVEDTAAARYGQRESVELAFIAAIQHLPGNERAALLLREVIGFSARDVAELMDATVPAVNSALQRARRLVSERVPAASQQATARSLGDARLRAIVDRYMDAFERADLDTLVELVTEDATWSMPPDSYQGRAAIAEFLVAGPLRIRWRHLPTWANGQAAVGCYEWDGDGYVATVLDVLTLRGDRIAEVLSFIDRTVFARFGLPDRLPA